MSKRFAPPEDDKEIFITHGGQEHSLLDAKLGKCIECKEDLEAFDAEVKAAGGIDKFIKKLEKEINIAP